MYFLLVSCIFIVQRTFEWLNERMISSRLGLYSIFFSLRCFSIRLFYFKKVSCWFWFFVLASAFNMLVWSSLKFMFSSHDSISNYLAHSCLSLRPSICLYVPHLNTCWNILKAIFIHTNVDKCSLNVLLLQLSSIASNYKIQLKSKQWDLSNKNTKIFVTIS